MTDATDTIAQVLDNHALFETGEHDVDGGSFIYDVCACGFVPTITDWHRTHVAAEIEKALGLRVETWRLDDGMGSTTGPQRPQTTQTRHVTPWASQAGPSCPIGSPGRPCASCRFIGLEKCDDICKEA